MGNRVSLFVIGIDVTDKPARTMIVVRYGRKIIDAFEASEEVTNELLQAKISELCIGPFFDPHVSAKIGDQT